MKAIKRFMIPLMLCFVYTGCSDDSEESGGTGPVPCQVEGATVCNVDGQPYAGIEYDGHVAKCEQVVNAGKTQLEWVVKDMGESLAEGTFCAVKGDSGFYAKSCKTEGEVVTDREDSHLYRCEKDAKGKLYLNEITAYTECAVGEFNKAGICAFDKISWNTSDPGKTLSSGYLLPAYCSLNSEDVKNQQCPVIYSLCDNPGASVCCGGNAYNCVPADDDAIKKLYGRGDVSYSLAADTFEMPGKIGVPVWIMGNCKAVSGSSCQVSEDWGAECVMASESCTIDENADGFENLNKKANYRRHTHCADYRGIQNSNCNDAGYTLVSSYCREDKNGATHVALGMSGPYEAGNVSVTCSDKGVVVDAQ